MNITTQSHTLVNSIDTNALREAIHAADTDPANAQTHWCINSTWRGGTRTDHQVDAFQIAGQRIDRSFTIRIDEPHQLCGTNQFANPQEHLLAAINACMMVGYAAVAALMGITLHSLQVQTRGDIDLRAFFGLDPSIPPGYPALTQTVRINADASDEQLRDLHETVKATSPNFYNITRAVPTSSNLIIEH